MEKLFDISVSMFPPRRSIDLKLGEEYECVFLKNDCNELVTKKLVAVQGECEDCIFHNHEENTCNCRNGNSCSAYDLILVEKKQQ